MSEKSTFEEKIITIVILSFFFGMGFWARSAINSPQLDGLVVITAVCLAVLMVLFSVLLSMRETE